MLYKFQKKEIEQNFRSKANFFFTYIRMYDIYNYSFKNKKKKNL